MSLLIILLILLSSCSTLVRIDSNVDDATIRINGENMGKTPELVDLSDFVFSEYDIQIEKEGYDTYRGKLRKEFKTGTFIGGFFLGGITWLWAYGPKPYQEFELDKLTE